jgi:glucosamine--fructose-6-phosphate aminotransferase (isomerizing)
VLWIPRTDVRLAPLVAAVPLQRLAYELAVALGRDIDRPRNLARSVTVE